MKHLFAIYVVSVKGDILLDKKVVAADFDEARFLAEVDGCIRAAKLAPKDVTVLGLNVGQVKTEAEPQKVKLVTEA